MNVSDNDKITAVATSKTKATKPRAKGETVDVEEDLDADEE